MLDVISGIVTVSISLVGLVVCLYHVFFYNLCERPLSKRIKVVFFTDGLIYLMTLLFGFWAFFGWDHETAIALHWVRAPVLIANIIASWQLYSIYKEISSD